MLSLRVAHRQRGLTTIQCGPDLEHFFVLGTYFQGIYLVEDSTLYVSKVGGGGKRDGTSMCHVPSSYRCNVMTRAICFTALPDSIPAFSISDAEFEVDGDDMLTWKHPPIWKLDWPRQGSFDVGSVRRAVTAGLQARLTSAKQESVDHRKVLTKVPQWARGVLLADEWMRLVGSLV